MATSPRIAPWLNRRKAALCTPLFTVVYFIRGTLHEVYGPYNFLRKLFVLPDSLGVVDSRIPFFAAGDGLVKKLRGELIERCTEHFNKEARSHWMHTKPSLAGGPFFNAWLFVYPFQMVSTRDLVSIFRNDNSVNVHTVWFITPTLRVWPIAFPDIIWIHFP